MGPTNDNVSEILIDKVADWLMRTSLSDAPLETIVKGFCERLAAAGLPLMRVHLSFSMLHPLRCSGLHLGARQGRGGQRPSARGTGA